MSVWQERIVVSTCEFGHRKPRNRLTVSAEAPPASFATAFRAGVSAKNNLSACATARISVQQSCRRELGKQFEVRYAVHF